MGIVSTATNALQSILGGETGLSWALSEGRAGNADTVLRTADIKSENVSIDVAEKSPVRYPVVLIYCDRLVNEQREKVQKASSDEEESRYSQRTMADLRDNLAGTKTAYALFQPWLLSKTDSGDPTKDGPTIDGKIQKGLEELETAYAAVDGDAIPQPPATWSAENPSAADLATPFGKLYSVVEEAVDPANTESVVAQMDLAAAALGFPQL